MTVRNFGFGIKIGLCTLAGVSLALHTTSCTRKGSQDSSAESERNSSDAPVPPNTKRLTADLSIDGSGGSLSLSGEGDAPLSIIAARGRVPGCVDDAVELRLSGATVSLDVPLACPASAIDVTAVDVNVVGFIGRIRLVQGQVKSISDDIGNWILSGLTIKRVSKRFTGDVAVQRDAGTLSASLSIDGSIECASASAHALSQSQVQIDLLGSFPFEATGSSGAGIAFIGISGASGQSVASWALDVPTTLPDGSLNSSVNLSWTDVNGLSKSCSLDTVVTLSTTAPNNQPVVESCGMSGAELCIGTPANYCQLPRLLALEIPELCAVGSCLLTTQSVVEELGTDPVVTSANCIAL